MQLIAYYPVYTGLLVVQSVSSKQSRLLGHVMVVIQVGQALVQLLEKVLLHAAIGIRKRPYSPRVLLLAYLSSKFFAPQRAVGVVR